jgi:hypothetical protein
VAGISLAYAGPAFQAAYRTAAPDVLLLGSASTSGSDGNPGNVYAINAADGMVLWHFSAGKPVTGLINYDAATDTFFVPTRGEGVKAYAILGSAPPPVGNPPDTGTVPSLKWRSPDTAGDYAVHCVRVSTDVACVTSGIENGVGGKGVVRVMDKTSGSLKAGPFTTSISGPYAPVLDSGLALPGLAISGATDGVEVLSIDTSKTPGQAIASRGTWTPPTNVAISSPAVFQDARRYLVVGGGTGKTATDGQRLYRISLDTPGGQAQVSAQITADGTINSKGTSETLGQPYYDTATGLYVVGTSEGHVWAIPSATFH